MECLGEGLEGALARLKLIGQAPTFLRAVAHLPALARSVAAVLVFGETGTGKELIARALHYLGPRADFPFVAVNCGSLPETLLEDELFGHERGAFTDARQPRPGVIAEADRGTLFLDEVDSLSLKAQVALLRFLQEKTYRAIGSSREQTADVRIVAATNAPLEEQVRASSFRADLYYRLCVLTLRLPPLRERREDILPLALHFLHKHAVSAAPPALGDAARDRLLAYDWPGNIRELENVMLRAVQLGPTDRVEADDLGLPEPGLAAHTVKDPLGFNTLKRLTIQNFERDYLTQLMTQYHGNVTHAARAAGKERRDLGRLLKKHQIDPKRF